MEKPAVIDYMDFVKADLRVGTIVSIEPVPKSKKLIKLEVSFGPTIGNRIILAGLASAHAKGHVNVGQRVMAVLNLAPREMFGITSNGMILASHDQSGDAWLVNPAGNPSGPVPDGAEVG